MSPEARPLPTTGQVLDRYRIESKLGEGGMGVVYKAHDTRLDRPVAIKVLPPGRMGDPTRRQRFVQEARAASALSHAGIVTVHDICAHDGIDFIVMEYVGGRTLADVIPAKGMKAGQALRHGIETADALARAHEAGIIHRDLKPSNLMVTEDGHIKVLDFGLAKLLDKRDVSAETRTQPSSITEEGTVVGTTAYMSPEQLEGRKLDGRSDVFSFGAVLYEMVTGRRPFAGESLAALQAKILSADPEPPSRLASSTSPDLDKLILRCLRKDPARRFQTMADLRVALEDLAADLSSGSGAPSTAASAPRRRGWVWAMLVPIVSVAAYLAWRAMRSPEGAAHLEAIPIVSLPGVTRSPSFSPDGSQIAFSWSGPDGGNLDVYVQQIGVGTPVRRTTDPQSDFSPMWSPDGRSIAYLRGDAAGGGGLHELRLVPPLGGQERKLAEVRPRGFLRAMTLAWCPDSSCLLLTDSLGEGKPDALFAVSLDTGEKRQLTSPREEVFADSDPAISPDGKALVFRRETAPFNGELMLLPFSADRTVTGEPRSLTPTSLPAYNPRWLPDGTAILFNARAALWRLPVTGEGKPERLPFVGENGSTPIVSMPRPGGPARLAYIRSYSDINIWRVETSAAGAPAKSPPVVAVASNRIDSIPHLAPDGRRVAFVSSRSGESEIWTADVNGANAVRVTSMSANPGWPRWSPDGQLIAFHSNPGGNAEIFVVPADGGKARNLTAHPAVDTFASFSRDGRFVYFTSNRKLGQQTAIWKVPVTGGSAAQQVTTGTGSFAIESRDGTSVYYVQGANSLSAGTLCRVPVAGGNAVKLTDGVNGGSFDVVDGGVYYLDRAGGEARLQYFDLASRTIVTVARNLGNLGAGLSASRDGRAILFSRIDSSLNDVMLVENFR
jgi:serine/threonine protein kinase